MLETLGIDARDAVAMFDDDNDLPMAEGVAPPHVHAHRLAAVPRFLCSRAFSHLLLLPTESSAAAAALTGLPCCASAWSSHAVAILCTL